MPSIPTVEEAVDAARPGTTLTHEHVFPPVSGKPGPLAEDFVRDVVDGIAGTGARADLLTCCVDVEGMTSGARRVAAAVAQAHLQTGGPVSVPTDSATCSALAALDVLCPCTTRGASCPARRRDDRTLPSIRPGPERPLR